VRRALPPFAPEPQHYLIEHCLAGLAIGEAADRPIAAEIGVVDQIRGVVRILR
jgi:hypothetical protein